MNYIKEDIGTTHFLGAGGVGMSALAKLCLKRGKRVSGTDLQAGRRTRELRELGAEIETGPEAQARRDANRVIVSSAIPPDHRELQVYQAMNIPILHRSDLLAEFISDLQSVVVAGTHGKTTTSSLIYHVLSSNGLSPTALLGGELAKEKTNCVVGTSDILIAEADESDGTLEKFQPQYAVLTSIDPDINVTSERYSGCSYNLDQALEEVTQVFLKFCLGVEKRLLVCCDHPNIKRMLRLIASPQWLTYGLDEEAKLRAVDVQQDGHCTQARIVLEGRPLGVLRVPLPGSHNLRNALAAVGIALNAGLRFEDIAGAIERFQGIRRRFEIVGESNGVIYVDDYAHNPQKIEAALAGARSVCRERVVAVFQPHRYTRSKLLQDQYPFAFDNADVILVTEIFGAGEEPITGVDGHSLYRSLVAAYPGKTILFAPGFPELKSQVQTVCRPGDLVVGLGAGSVGGWMRRLAQPTFFPLPPGRRVS